MLSIHRGRLPKMFNSCISSNYDGCKVQKVYFFTIFALISATCFISKVIAFKETITYDMKTINWLKVNPILVFEIYVYKFQRPPM